MNTFDFFVDGLDSIKIYRDEEYMLKAEFRIVKKHLIDLLDKRLGESKYKSVVKNKVNQLNQMSVRDCNEQFFRQLGIQYGAREVQAIRIRNALALWEIQVGFFEEFDAN